MPSTLPELNRASHLLLQLVMVLLVILSLPAHAEDQRVEGKPYTQKMPGSPISFNLVPIPGGKFTMGSPATEKGHKVDEGPQFTVEVDPFWMANCTVTQAEYNLFLDNYSR